MENLSDIVNHSPIKLDDITLALEKVAVIINDIINDNENNTKNINIDITYDTMLQYLNYLISLSKVKVPNLDGATLDQLLLVDKQQYDDSVDLINQIISYAEYLIDNVKRIEVIFKSKYREVAIDKLIV